MRHINAKLYPDPWPLPPKQNMAHGLKGAHPRAGHAPHIHCINDQDVQSSRVCAFLNLGECWAQEETSRTHFWSVQLGLKIWQDCGESPCLPISHNPCPSLVLIHLPHRPQVPRNHPVWVASDKALTRKKPGGRAGWCEGPAPGKRYCPLTTCFSYFWFPPTFAVMVLITLIN